MQTAADLAAMHALTYPLIVKPAAEDASIGIDTGAVVDDAAAMVARVRFVWDKLRQPALVEEFIDGRELNVALLATSRAALETLPPSEVLFNDLAPGAPRIVTFDAKWVTNSVMYKATPTRCPAVIDAALADRVREVASSAARVVGLRDYGRVDLRVRDEAVFVLEVNPNPDLSHDAGFMRAAAASGRSVTQTVAEILARALERARATTPKVLSSGS